MQVLEFKHVLWYISCRIMFTGVAVVNSTEPGSFCSETKECLLYDLICQGNEYEVRQCVGCFISYVFVFCFFLRSAIMRLLSLNYIRGENEAFVNIDMTTPVIIKVEREFSKFNKSIYVVNFPLHLAYQKHAPKPIDSLQDSGMPVFLDDLPDMRVYVEQYGGWMVSATSSIQAYFLKDALNCVQATYHKDYHYYTILTNRHNEVWYVVHGTPVCAASG
uniref:Heme-binding protein soul5, like n=1 Tax=Electrophorus electricus TaxID=8005 RepID=A0A4W4HAW1_ELEEL